MKTKLPTCSSMALLAAMILIPSQLPAERVARPQGGIQPPSPEWKGILRTNAPERTTTQADPRQVLVFSLHTGYHHQVIPHVGVMVEILGEKTGAFQTTITKDIEDLAPERLKGFDVLVLNNNCSVGPRRNLLLDELERHERYAQWTPEKRQARANLLEQSMLDFVAQGKGLVVIHGAPTLLNNSPEFSGMVGGAFDYHPPSQDVTLHTVDASHPLVAAFEGKEPFIHFDEPYCFKGAYTKLDFRPLLEMQVEGIKDPRGKVGDMTRYVSWIRAHGDGRVFYCSPSHYPDSYTSPTLLRYILDGIQYAAGDLSCDDSTPRPE